MQCTASGQGRRTREGPLDPRLQASLTHTQTAGGRRQDPGYQPRISPGEEGAKHSPHGGWKGLEPGCRQQLDSIRSIATKASGAQSDSAAAGTEALSPPVPLAQALNRQPTSSGTIAPIAAPHNRQPSADCLFENLAAVKHRRHRFRSRLDRWFCILPTDSPRASTAPDYGHTPHSSRWPDPWARSSPRLASPRLHCHPAAPPPTAKLRRPLATD
jgi:hypothetical protein